MNTSRGLRRSLLLALIVAPACSFGFHQFGNDLSERDGVLYSGDVALRFARWVAAEQPPAGATVTLETGTGPIALTAASSPDAFTLEAHLFSEVENDGRLAWEDGRLVARSDSGHEVAVNGVRGGVPPGHKLQLGTGTGEISAEGLAGGSEVHVDSGTGRTVLRECEFGLLDIETGTGRMELSDVRATTVQIESGTGDAELERCTATSLEFSSGTGDLGLTDSRFERSTLESGTGDVVLRQGSSLGNESVDLGTGEQTVIQG